MTTALPVRLRTLADLVEINGLPDPTFLSISTSEYGQTSLHYDDRAAVDAWAAVLGLPVRVQHVRAGQPDEFTAYVVENGAVSVVFHDHSPAPVPA